MLKGKKHQPVTIYWLKGKKFREIEFNEFFPSIIISNKYLYVGDKKLVKYRNT